MTLTVIISNYFHSKALLASLKAFEDTYQTKKVQNPSFWFCMSAAFASHVCVHMCQG